MNNNYGFEYISNVLLSLSRKRNQSKKALTDMIKIIMDNIYSFILERDIKVSVLKSIIEITEGKIYVEYEYSWAVRKLTEIYISDGDLEKATSLIQDIQVETFGSLDKVYKVEYILFQIDILISKGDFIRAFIVSNKIQRKYLDNNGLEYLKIDYYNLMIKYFNHEENFLEVSKCYKELYDYSSKINNNILDFNKVSNSINNANNVPSKPNDKSTNIKEILDEKKIKIYKDILNNKLNREELFEKYVIFLNICPPNQEYKSNLNILRENYVKELDSNLLLGKLVKLKLGDDITKINNQFINIFSHYLAFKNNEIYYNNGDLNLKLFRKYFIQHNLLIINKYFSQINIKRISQLIDINPEEVEHEICNMVTNEYMYSRINRIKGIVNFRKKRNFDDKLNNLDSNLHKMLYTLESTCHLIHKENLKYDIK